MRERGEAFVQELESLSARTHLARLRNQTGSPCVLEPHLLNSFTTVTIRSGVLCLLISTTSMLCVWYACIFPNTGMGLSERGDSQKRGRSRGFGGERHGRKLTKDAINVFLQAANARRTKSWLHVGLVWHLTARNRSRLIIRHTKVIYNLGDSRYISSQDYGQSPAEAKKTGPWQIGDWASGRG
jgi:hypothetical protein